MAQQLGILAEISERGTENEHGESVVFNSWLRAVAVRLREAASMIVRLREEREEANARALKAASDAWAAEAARDAARAEARALREALKMAERNSKSESVYENVRLCVICDQSEARGHSPDCPFALLTPEEAKDAG